MRIAFGVLAVCFCLSLVLCFVLLVDKMSARMAEERLCEAQTNAGHLLLGCRGATDADIEITRRMLYSAYKVDFDYFGEVWQYCWRVVTRLERKGGF